MLHFVEEHAHDRMFLSSLSRVEVQSVLNRLENDGRFSSREIADIGAKIEQDWNDIDEVRITGPVIQRASRVVRTHRLRTLDSIQLATAILARDLVPNLVFVSSDTQLIEAAVAESFEVFDPLRGA